MKWSFGKSTHGSLIGVTLAALASGCAGPKFTPVAEIPTGRALLYVYATPGAMVGAMNVYHNGSRLGPLGPRGYFYHYPEPGTNVYGFHLGFMEKGGIIGSMLTTQDPEATRIRLAPGQRYYLRMIGYGAGASLWRVDESTALAEMKELHLQDVLKSEREEHERTQRKEERHTKPGHR